MQAAANNRSPVCTSVTRRTATNTAISMTNNPIRVAVALGGESKNARSKSVKIKAITAKNRSDRLLTRLKVSRRSTAHAASSDGSSKRGRIKLRIKTDSLLRCWKSMLLVLEPTYTIDAGLHRRTTRDRGRVAHRCFHRRQ